MEEFAYKDINVVWENNLLTLQNSRLIRKIDFTEGLPRTLQFTIDQIALAGKNPGYDFRLAGFPAPDFKNYRSDYQAQNIFCTPLGQPDGDGRLVTVEIFESIRKLKLEISYIIYPDQPFMAVESVIISGVTPMLYWHPRHGNATFHGMDADLGVNNICDALALQDFTPVKSVELQMRTDYNDEPILEHAIEDNKDIYGNIFLADNARNARFFFLQEAPPSQERRGNEPGDFLLTNDCTVASLGSGITAADITPDRRLKTNRTVCGLAADGDAEKLIKQYLRIRQVLTNSIGNNITVNPWGCGCFPELLNEQFLKDEITAAGAVGADTYQIDDGYEHGLLQDLAVHNRKLDKAFWATNEKLLPEGFHPLISHAQDNNIKLSLWFAPSFNCEYKDWRTSADILLEHFRQENFESFKLDAVIFNSYTAEENFGKLLQTLYNESEGKISVNLDVTNGTRGGLFKFSEYGLVFLENRYCCHTWVTNPYHPENTLDNLWNLAKYCRIQNLQIEVPNPGNCKADVYEKFNMSIPTEYPLAYWAAIPFFASPLLWMAPSQLSEENAAILRKSLDVFRQYRQEWREALISPVGSRPDGKSITGFYADSGFLLVFREAGAPEQAKLDLPEFTGYEVLYNSGDITLAADGTVTMAAAKTFALLRLR